MNQCSKLQSEIAASRISDADVRDHLASCAECRQASETARLNALLRAMPMPPLPGSFDAGLQSKLEAASAARSPWHMLARSLCRGSAAALPARAPLGALGLSAGIAAALVGAIFLAPHFDGHSGIPALPASMTAARYAPLPNSLPQGDAAFIAACSSQRAQTASAQPLGDPSATALAASLDETQAGWPASDQANADADQDASNPAQAR